MFLFEILPVQHLWPVLCVTTWSLFSYENPSRQMTCLPTHLSRRQEIPHAKHTILC